MSVNQHINRHKEYQTDRLEWFCRRCNFLNDSENNGTYVCRMCAYNSTIGRNDRHVMQQFGYQIGEQVEYYNLSKKIWIPARVESFSQAAGSYLLHCGHDGRKHDVCPSRICARIGCTERWGEPPPDCRDIKTTRAHNKDIPPCVDPYKRMQPDFFDSRKWWICAHCKEYNRQERTLCKCCSVNRGSHTHAPTNDTPRTHSPTNHTPRSRGYWFCYHCEEYNKEGRMRCNDCGASRPAAGANPQHRHEFQAKPDFGGQYSRSSTPPRHGCAREHTPSRADTPLRNRHGCAREHTPSRANIHANETPMTPRDRHGFRDAFWRAQTPSPPDTPLRNRHGCAREHTPSRENNPANESPVRPGDRHGFQRAQTPSGASAHATASPRTPRQDKSPRGQAGAFTSASQAVAAAMQHLQSIAKITTLDERKRAFRDLQRSWHPDKNPENVELATKVFQKLQSERRRFVGS